MPSSFVALTPSNGWEEDTTAVGYYIHKGICYLDGTIFAVAPDATQAIIDSIPEEARPNTDLPVTLIYTRGTTDFTRDAAVLPPSTYAATVTADGRLVLNDPVPDAFNNTPSVADFFYIDSLSPTVPKARYDRPPFVGIWLGGVSWPLPGVVQSDNFVWLSLAPFLGPDFEDINSTYAVHNSRVHLGGSVRCLRDGAVGLATSLPADALSGLQFADATRITRVDDSVLFGLFVEPNAGLLVDGDTGMKPKGQSRPVGYSTPVWQPDDFVGGHLPYIYDQNFGLTDGPVQDDRFLHSFGTCQTYGHFELLDPPEGPVDFGTLTCGIGGDTCLIYSATAGTLVYDLDHYLAATIPTADWVLLVLGFEAFNVQHGQVASNSDCVGTHCPDFNDTQLSTSMSFADDPTGIGADWRCVQVDGVTTEEGTDGSLIVSPGAFINIPSENSEGAHSAGYEGFIAPGADRQLYTGATFNGYGPGESAPLDENLPPILGGLPGSLLWRADQIGGTFTIDWALANLHKLDTIISALSIVPLYETRQDGLYAGDVLSLVGAGFVGDPAIPPAMPGTIAAGPFVGGTVRIPAPEIPRGPLLPRH